MRGWVPLLSLAGLAAVMAVACSSSSQCVIDTDCPLYQRCAAKKCVPVGGTDAGRSESGVVDASRPDAAPPHDAGTPDGGAMEGGATEAGPGMDGAAGDAASEGGTGVAMCSAADQAIIMAQSVPTTAWSCGGTCGFGTTTDPCISTCVSTMTAGDGGTGLSTPCADCYQALIHCAVAHCLTACTDPGAATCATCLCDTTMGACYAQLGACTGVPPTCM